MLRIFFIAALNVFIVILIAVLLYVGALLYGAYTLDQQSVSNLIDPRDLLRRISFQKEKWEVYTSKSFTFEHPEDWNPKDSSVYSAGDEVVDLRIPDLFSIVKIGSRNFIGFSKQTVEERRPKNVKSETEFIMMDRKGYKWVYEDDKQIIYQYIIPLSTDSVVVGQRYSFFIRVASIREDRTLEERLDRVAQSVKKIENN